MAQMLHAAGATHVVITLGADGALAFNGTDLFTQAAYPVSVVDATAAGDAFVAALAVAMAEGHSWPQVLQAGTAAGALAAMKHGAMPSLPTRDEVQRLIESAIQPPAN